MIGKKQLVLDASTWLRGMSSGTDISDGGFSNDTEAVNLTAQPGTVYAPALAVDSDTDTRLTDEIIASSPGHNVLLPAERLMVAENGSYYSYNGTKIPAAALQTDAVNTYQVGFTDIINYAGETYVTSKEKIIRWSGTSTFDNSFFTFANATSPHPAIVYENNVFYGDKNLLLRQTAVAGTPATILTLSADNIIMAIGIDPGSGLMLISTTSALNVSGTVQGVNKLLWYNGSSNKVTKSVITGEIITAFHSVGSTVFVGYGRNLGFVNGSGVQFLRNLKNVTNDVDLLPYKHKLTSIGNTFYIADGTQVLAYGEVLPGRKIFYYAVKNKVNTNKFKSIFSVGNNKLGFSVATSKFYTVNMTTVANLNKFLLTTNFLHFPRPVHIRSIQLEFFGDVASTGNLSVIAYDQELYPTTIAPPATVTSSKVIRKMIGFPAKQDALKLQIENATTNDGLKRIIIYYDVAE